jgi:hypothetical protein
LRAWARGAAVCGLHELVVPLLHKPGEGGCGGWRRRSVWARSLVENCTVDASIFLIVSLWSSF